MGNKTELQQQVDIPGTTEFMKKKYPTAILSKYKSN